MAFANAIPWKEMFRKLAFNFTYVQLFQLHFFADLSLLQPIDITDINHQPYPWLYDEDLRLENVSHITSDIWKEEIKTKKIWELCHDKDLLNQ